MDYQEQIQKIRDFCDMIQPNKVTILTGKNGSGKSLVRKTVGFFLSEKLGFGTRKKPSKCVTSSTSLQQRTELRSDFGAFSSFLHDSPDSPTGFETIKKIQGLLKSLKKGDERFIIIDEPEIGMREELVVSLTDWLNSTFEKIPEFCYGVLIITHNRYLVENLKSEFLNFEGMSKDEWLNRKIIPTDLDEFEKDSRGLFLAIQQEIKNNS